jgi:hypothetical protein
MTDIRTITVVECKPRTYGPNHPKAGQIVEGVTNGRAWRIHSVQAVDDTGLPIQEKMTAFRPLPVGEVIQAKFTRKDDEKYGPEYTVEQVGGSPAPNSSVTGNFQQPVPSIASPDEYEMIRESVRLLVDRVRCLEDACKAAGILPSLPGSDVPAPPVIVPQAASQGVTVGAATVRDEDEPPF